MLVTHGLVPKPYIVNITHDTDVIGTLSEGTDGTVAAVHYKPIKIRQAQIKWHGELQSSDSKHGRSNWRPEVNLSENYSKYRKKLPEMMKLFADMWGGRLDELACQNVASIQPLGSTSTLDEIPGGPHSERLLARWIEKIREQEVIKPSTTKWAARIVFASLKDGYNRFYIDFGKLNEVI